METAGLELTMREKSIGFLGAGRMATALAAGIVRAGGPTAPRIVAADPAASARDAFARAVASALLVDANEEVVRAADVVVLAVKPQDVDAVLSGIQPYFGQRHLLVSVAAGISTRTLVRQLAPFARVVRAMPNTPCLIGLGCSVYCLGGKATRQDGELVARLLSTVGETFAVEEHLLDAVTGLSGSGPAYVFTMIEALGDGGVAEGLPRALATRLAALTVRGAAAMVLENQEHPAVLREGVTSPAGTTAAGLEQLEQGAVRYAIASAVRAAAARSRALDRG